jgi:hypothetical protein
MKGGMTPVEEAALPLVAVVADDGTTVSGSPSVLPTDEATDDSAVVVVVGSSVGRTMVSGRPTDGKTSDD